MDALPHRSIGVSEESRTQRLLEHEELRDIHARIDSLKEEQQRHYNKLSDKLQALEVSVARGGRFPASAWMAAVGIFVSVIGVGAVLYSELQTAKVTAGKALVLIEQHMSGASARLQSIEHFEAISERWETALPLLEERVRVLEGKVVGHGPGGWHRADHDLYDRAVRAQFAELQARMEALEARRK